MPPAASAGRTSSAERDRTTALVSIVRLQWFIRLRWAFVVVALLGLAIERFFFPSAARSLALGAVVVVLAAANLVWLTISRLLRREFHEEETPSALSIRQALVFANAQVAVDLLLLTFFVRYTGGIESPMVVFYLFHMAIGALLLRGWHAVMQGFWAVLLYAALAIGEWQAWLAPHYPLVPGGPGRLFQQPVYVGAAITFMACGVFGMLYLALDIAGRLDRRERQLRAVNTALQTSQHALEDLQRRRSRFLQIAAHQLKSPLAAIQTLVGLVRDGIVPPAGVPATCEKVIHRCQDGINQVTELLTLARAEEADPDRHRRQRSDVGAIVNDLCQHCAAFAEGKGVALRCNIRPHSDLRACIDPLDLANCVGNLIDNAIKYTDQGGEVEVTVSAGAESVSEFVRRAARGGSPRQRGDCVIVTVRDTGMGIDAKLLPVAGGAQVGSVFDAFRRGDRAVARNIPGTGLGLAIVREVVEQAGGRIRVVSRPGRGSTFSVLLPAGPPADEATAVRDTRASEVCVEAPGPNEPEARVADAAADRSPDTAERDAQG